jgi:hypothetical protein
MRSTAFSVYARKKAFFNKLTVVALRAVVPVAQ